MFRRETPVWANVFVCCEGEVRTGIPDPLEAQQTNYNLDESVPLHSSACGWGASPTDAHELGCLDRALHTPRWEAGRPARSLRSPPARAELAPGHCGRTCGRSCRPAPQSSQPRRRVGHSLETWSAQPSPRPRALLPLVLASESPVFPSHKFLTWFKSAFNCLPSLCPTCSM